MTLPPITTKQQEIIKLLYKYRFLNRIQIQQLLNHKDKRRIISWLKDLREKQYIDWHYDSTDFVAKSRPAIYYVSLNAIRYLRDQNQYPNPELKKRYKEPERTQVFIDRCLLVADCCITLRDKSDNAVLYRFILPTDYIGMTNQYHFLADLQPHLYFSKHQDNKVINYLLENFDAALPRYHLRKRLKDYIDFIDEWGATNQPKPIALFVCANIADLLYAKRRMRKIMEEEGIDLQARVTTLEKIETSGVTSMIWEEV